MYFCREIIRGMSAQADFDAIFRKYYTPLFFFARQYVDDKEECRDIVMSTYEKAWNNMDRLDPNHASTFLYVTTRNLCIDYLRHLKHHQNYTRYFETMTKDIVEGVDLIEREELQKVANQRISSLRQPTRDIFVSCYVDKKKYREVALERGISVSTVKKHIVKALRLMREARQIASDVNKG